MSPQVGDGPMPGDYDELWAHPTVEHGIVYAAASERVRGLVELVRPLLVEATVPAAARVFELGDDEPVSWLGWAVAEEHGLPAPLSALAHRDMTLAYHRDRRAPYPCTNATVFFRRSALGGVLVFPDARVALEGEDGYTAVFDGQRLHGMRPLALPLEGGYRISLTFYCPLGSAGVT